MVKRWGKIFQKNSKTFIMDIFGQIIRQVVEQKNTVAVNLEFVSQRHLDMFKRTPSLRRLLHSSQLEGLRYPGANRLTVNHYIYSQLQNIADSTGFTLTQVQTLNEFTEKVIYQLVQKFTKEGGPKEDVIRIYIQRFKQIQNKVEQKDPFKYTWKEFERVVDANQTSRIKAGKLNPTVSDANLIYNQGGIRIYVGKDKKSCIKYGGGYSWCISARGEDNMYSSYRLSNVNRENTPYFIFNDNLSSERKGSQFVDDNHALVIFVEYDTNDDIAAQYRYSITTAANDGDIDYYDLEEIQEDFPWITQKIFDLIKPVAPPDEEVQAEKIDDEYNYGVLDKLTDVDKLKQFQGLEEVIPGSWFQKRVFILELTRIADQVGAEKLLAAIENKKFLITKAVIDSWFMTSPGDTPQSLRKDNHEPRGTYTDYFWVLSGSEEDLIKKIQDFLPTLEKDPEHNYYGGPSVHAIGSADLIPIYQNKRVHNDMEYIAMTIRDLQTERDSALSKLKLGIKN